MSTVGVVIPCYKYGHLLHESVGSALDQPGVDVRVLVIDDASPDDSAIRAKELAAADSRIEVWVHDDNRGHITTYNEGLLQWCAQEAKTDYSVLLSADDRLTPGSLTRAVAFLDDSPEIGFAYGHYIRFDGTEPAPPARSGPVRRKVYEGGDWLRRRFRAGNGCIASPEVVVRTELQAEVGGYDRELPHTGDIEMWMRFAARADVGYLGGCDQAYYRVHDANMHHAYGLDAGIGDLRQRLDAYLSLLAKDGALLPDAAELENTVRRALAKDSLWRACRAYDRRRTESEPVEELAEFARQCYPDVETLPEFRGLRLRRRIGPERMPLLAPFVARAYVRRAKNELWWRRWERVGV